MNFAELNKHDIYPVSVPGHSETVLMVYAPLTGDVFFSKRSAVEQQELELKRSGSASLESFMSMIIGSDAARKPELVNSPLRLQQLDLILNYKCNFSCSYCFSAQGRACVEISDPALRHVLQQIGGRESEYDIDKVVFTGGGEPLLSFPLLKDAVNTIRHWEKNSDAGISVVTNGSLLTDEILDFFRSNAIELVVSFEILRDLQETQRGHYDLCMRNISRAIELELVPGIRVTITPVSVGRMSEMLDELHRTFPRIKSLAMETVVAPELFASSDELRDFYQKFIRQFSECRKHAAAFGLTPYCTSFMALDSLKTRMCPGKLCLTSEGNITNCSRVSSNREELSGQYFYGTFSENGIAVDEAKFRKHTECHALKSFPECRNCWVRWNCGGGCARIRDTFPDEYFAAYCNFVRGCIMQEILDRYDAACREHCGTLDDHLHDLENE